MSNDSWFSEPSDGSHFAGDPWPGQQQLAAPPPLSPARPRWWTSRPAVAFAAGLLGVLIGAGGVTVGTRSTNDDKTELATKVQTLTAQRGDLQDQVGDLQESAIAPEAVEEKVASAVAEARTEAAAKQETAVAAAVAAAVASAVAKERKRTQRLVAEAEESEEPSGSAAGGGTDPRFGTCGEANDSGYGSYTSGVDPEYDWYQDRDGDGVVCES